MELRSEAILGVPRQRVTAHRLAGLGTAQSSDVPSGRRSAEIVIEGDDAVHLGAGNVERFSYPRQSLGRDIAQPLLDRMQKRQQATGSRSVRRNRLFHRGVMRRARV